MTKQTEVKQPINKTKGAHKFDQGSVLSVLLKVAAPIVILMVFNTLYAFVDSLMSSTYVDYGVSPTGAEMNGGTSIGLIFPLMGFLLAFQVMISVGDGLAYTQAVAQGDQVEAQRRHDQSLGMILYMGTFMFVIMAIIGLPYLITVSGNWATISDPSAGNWGNAAWGDNLDTSSVEYGMLLDGYFYMLVLGVAFIPMQLNNAYVRVLRAEGAGNMAALIPILTFPVNLGLDYFLMHGMGMGLVGAGIATLVAQLVGFVLIVIYVYAAQLQNRLQVKLRMPAFRLDKAVVIIILTFAAGSLFRRLFDNTTVITLSTFMGNLNVDNANPSHITDWTGSWTVMTRSINVGSMLALGIAQSMSMLISYYVNSNQRHKMKETLMYGFGSMIIATLFASLLMIGLQGVLFNAYQPGSHFGWEWGNDLSIAFILAMIYAIPLSLQPASVMYYAGTKQPKATLIHSVMFNGIVILFATLGFALDLQLGQPLYMFGTLVIGVFIAFVAVILFFVMNIKQSQKTNI